MLRWRKVAHAIRPRKRQLMRDQQDDVRGLKKKDSPKETNIKILQKDIR